MKKLDAPRPRDIWAIVDHDYMTSGVGDVAREPGRKLWMVVRTKRRKRKR